ncbi:unnamed protein product [Colletotrichum noveboracense]|uniref:Uncharacterized protein n=1 Tax=Colletotrichum noveboracense TaxID=2664923 RepID=A0A9W4RQH3_9PEZI|nr:unnamed protein product [Colletotrichum noveboracense]
MAKQATQMGPVCSIFLNRVFILSHLDQVTVLETKLNTTPYKQNLTSHKMSSRPVIIHQAAPSISSAYTASSGSYPSSNGSYTPRSLSPADPVYHRVHGAENHMSSSKVSSKRVTVVNRNQSGYEHGAPSPNYGGTFRRS